MKPLEQEEIKRLIRTAKAQLDYSYAPYSHFHVGAALLAKTGTYILAAILKMPAILPVTVQSGRHFKAVSEGVKDFDAICVTGGMNGVVTDYTAPCGVCRQVMMEFCDPKEFQIIVAIDEERYIIKTLEELLPLGFGPGNLKEKQ